MIKPTKLQQVSYTLKASLLLSLSSAAIAEINSDVDTMVVTASGFEQEIKNAPATISVITPGEISNKPYRDVTDALKDIPGVNITGSGENTDISIRGMDAKYTLILVDGKRVSTREARPNSDGAGFEQGWLPPLSAIERIEVVRGPMSSLYGSDAMGGVVNIITKKITNEWLGSVRLESVFQADSKAKNYYNSNFSVMGPLIADILGIQLYGQYADRDEDEYLNGHAAQKLKSINGRLLLNASETQLFELDFSRKLQTSTETEGKTVAPKGSALTRDNRRNSISLTHKGSWDLLSSDSFISYEEDDNPVRDMNIKNTDFDTRLLIPLSNHILSVGGKYAYQELSDRGNKLDSAVSKLERWDYALFAEDEWQIWDDWSMTFGLRFNKDENYGNNFNPRVYSVWSIDENYTLKGGFSTGYTTPLLRQVVSDWGQITGRGKGIILGNPDLKPEKSDNLEIALAYTNEDGLNASATAFYTKFKDKIQSYDICRNGSLGCIINGQGYDFIQSRENIDRADIKGIELSFKTPILEKFVLSSSYAWTKSEQKTGENKGAPLNRTAKQKFSTQLDWTVSEQWDLWAKVSYYGRETSVSRNSVQNMNYPGYTFWDMGGSYAINNQTKLYAGIYNLFDKKVESNDFGKTLEGRRYWMGTEINF